MDYTEEEESCLESRLEIFNRLVSENVVSLSPTESQIKIKKRKTSSVMRRKPTTSVVKPSESYDLDEKIREKVRFIVGRVFEERRYLHTDRNLSSEKMFRWVMEFLSERGYWPTEDVKDKFILSLYAVLTGLRLKGIFLDPHLLSLEFNVSFKVFQKYIFECMPYITCETEIEKRIVRMSVSLDRFSAHRDYSNVLLKLIPQITEEGVKAFESRCRYLFEILSQRGVCDDEKQFCVTADKVFIYGIFETLKTFFPDKTERILCEQLAERFSMPRVTIEKMKRLINKTLKRVPPPPNSE